jgi:integrase/recombinase XerC
VTAHAVLLSPAWRSALASWLDHLQAIDGMAGNTLDAYRTDVLGFLSFLQIHHGESQGIGPLARVTVADMRAWMAHERGPWSGPRSLARGLSSVKGFMRWLADREGFDPTAVLATRAPKFRKPSSPARSPWMRRRRCSTRSRRRRPNRGSPRATPPW